ncbi:MAG: 2-dehydro-3-deoxygalactonokinase [Caulobacteraceae bacterium]
MTGREPNIKRADFIAVDWGTTNRRAYWIGGDGAVVQTLEDGAGILAVEPGGFADAAEALRARLGGGKMLLAGMVGSDRGWMDAGYVPCPAGLDDLALAAVAPAEGARIVPGVSRTAGGRADVMRGEEVQFLGAAAAGLVPPGALVCQPGTHCKWARMAAGAIADFTTAMTGEMFAILKAHAMIGREMTADAVADDADFAAGVAASAKGDLLAALFGVRAARLLATSPGRDAASFVSGLLIGGDCRARPGEAGEAVFVLADGRLGALYARAIGIVGGRAVRVDGRAAFVAGAVAIMERSA